ncbi:hypothetical protein [Cloacibacterium sp.]|uniref:hypothetical protein n=1 Tax=Cloacibacterium sp. TaxID=1913682 RepID=UPI0039E222B6
MITYQIEEKIEEEEFTQVLLNSTLGERRPVNKPERIVRMLKHANLIATVRDNEKLIGVSRLLTDFVYCTYLSDLAVDENGNKQRTHSNNKKNIHQKQN